MDIKKKISVSLLTIITIFLIGFIVGATILKGYVEYTDDGSVPGEISAPSWEAGKFWTYSFKTPYIEDVISRIVVASEEEENYLIGVASRLDAQRHAVLNYNPMLGRITINELSIYEKGIPQPLFNFPLKKNKEWSFNMFGIEEFQARVDSIRSADLPGSGETVIAEIQASSTSGETLIYSYDKSAEWVRSLVLEDSSGVALLEMNLVSCGKGFAGDVFFVRGVDLVDELYTAPVFDVFNTLIMGHPDWGPFDSLVYHYEVLTEDNSGGTLVVKDPTSVAESMRRVFGPNSFESSLGTIPSESEELSVSVSLAGESYLRLRIAGGIEYIWTV